MITNALSGTFLNMSENIIKIKSYDLAIKVVLVYKELTQDKKEYILSKQFLRSGTAIGALIHEAEYAESKKDFVHKLSISLKETNETVYWIDLLTDTFYLNEEKSVKIKDQLIEIRKLLISIIRTSKRRMKNNQ